jgi:hypothetical protein
MNVTEKPIAAAVDVLIITLSMLSRFSNKSGDRGATDHLINLQT